MFSKKPQLAVQAASPAPAKGAGPLAILTNPYAGAGGAAVLLLASLAALVIIGDPKAGAPSVRIPVGGESGAALTDTPVEIASLADPNDPLIASLAGAENSETGPTEVTVTLPGGEQQVMSSAPAGRGLPAAPIAGLHQQGPGGLLPIIAADGRTPAQAYARPFTSNGKPKVAVVIGGLGIDPATTRKAIETLPADVTLSFAIYAEGLQGWIDLARAYGHEVLIEAPMEPKSFPADDPGPQTLMAAAKPDETLRRLDILLSRATGYFGVTNYMGSKFVASTGAMETFTGGLKRRGLAFIDDGSAVAKGGGIPRASADKIIDDQPGAEAIGRKLAEVEAQATKRGFALASGFGYQVTLSEVSRWAQTLPQRGYQLAPASAVTVRR